MSTYDTLVDQFARTIRGEPLDTSTPDAQATAAIVEDDEHRRGNPEYQRIEAMLRKAGAIACARADAEWRIKLQQEQAAHSGKPSS